MRLLLTILTLTLLASTTVVHGTASAQNGPKSRLTKAPVTPAKRTKAPATRLESRSQAVSDKELTEEEKLAVARKRAAALQLARAEAAKRSAAQQKAAQQKAAQQKAAQQKAVQQKAVQRLATQRRAAAAKAQRQSADQLKAKKLAEAKLRAEAKQRESARQRASEVASLEISRAAKLKNKRETRKTRSPGQTLPIAQLELTQPIYLPGQNEQEESGQPSSGGINPTGRPETEETPDPDSSDTRAPIGRLPNGLEDLVNPNDRGKVVLPVTEDESDEDADAGGSYAPVNYADVQLSMSQSNVTLAPGTHYLTVQIDRNGYEGNLYTSCLFTEIYSPDQANLLRGQMTPVPSVNEGLPYSDGTATVGILVNANAPHGMTREFKITGATCEGPYLTLTPMFFTVTVDNPEPEVTEEEEEPTTTGPETTDSGTITISSGGIASPFISGGFGLNGQPIGAFYDFNNNGRLDFVNGGNASYVYPRKPTLSNASSQGFTLSRGSAFDGNANVAVVAMMSTWSSVVRPQFVVLYLNVSSNGVTPVSMWAGDNSNTASLPQGGTMQGVVMANLPDSPPQISIEQVQLPGNGTHGVLKGTAVANVFFTSPVGGSTYGNTIQFEFDVPLHYDQLQP